MITKYDIGQEVYLKGRVSDIKITAAGNVEYRVQMDVNRNYIDMIPEEKIYQIVEEEPNKTDRNLIREDVPDNWWWVCTDPDTNQYRIQFRDDLYVFMEIRKVLDKYYLCSETIDLEEYWGEEQLDAIKPYYPKVESLDDLELFPQSLIAECIFEQIPIDELTVCKKFDSLEDAKNEVLIITGGGKA